MTTLKGKNVSIVHSVNILMKMGAKLQNYEIRNIIYNTIKL